MIKINLSTSQKQVDISNIGGFDFTKLKIKAVALVLVLLYIPDFVILPIWEESLAVKNAELQAEQTKLNSLKRKISQAKNYEKQIKELKAQEEALGKKLLAVKEAISLKKNPASLLLYVAKNTPEGLWIRELLIDKDILLVKGEALNYNSIGNFVTSLRSSVFIKDANIVSTVSTVREPDKTRIETFEVKFSIARFEQ